MIRNFLTVLILTATVSSYSAMLEFEGTEPVHLKINTPGIQGDMTDEKIIQVMRFKLSPEAQQLLKKRLSKRGLNTFDDNHETLPSKVSLGMNGVPVLDQGRHGSCVTFAVTGAVDAGLNLHQDYVSQLCNLELGKYLEAHTGQPSGWNGSSGEIVLQQLSQYGYMNRDDEHYYGCGGLKDYPLRDPREEGKAMSPEDFAKHSYRLPTGVAWDTLLRWEDTFDKNYDPNKALHNIKQTLAEGHRISFGVLLDVAVGQVGAVGSHHAPNDSWILNDKIVDDVKHGRIHAGHEMIIIGYDDAMNIGSDKGAFILRNSWSDRAGDRGTYYMSYDYFKLMTDEAYRIQGRADQPQI